MSLSEKQVDEAPYGSFSFGPNSVSVHLALPSCLSLIRISLQTIKADFSSLRMVFHESFYGLSLFFYPSVLEVISLTGFIFFSMRSYSSISIVILAIAFLAFFLPALGSIGGGAEGTTFFSKHFEKVWIICQPVSLSFPWSS